MTDEFELKLNMARGAEPSFGLAREQQLIWRIKGLLLARRRTVSTIAAVATLAASVALAFYGLGSYGKGSPGARASSGSEGVGLASVVEVSGAELWNLRDGSRILIESAATRIEKKHESSTEMAFELSAGTARFDVAPRPERMFSVRAGSVAVHVIGTKFRVERHGPRSVVSVEQGRVRVSWPAGSRELTTGERGAFPPERPSEAPSALARAGAPRGAAAATPPSAPAIPRTEPPPNAVSSAEALFAEADLARVQGRYADAVEHLSAITSRHPSDPRAPLAAFTRGRLLLETLGRPAEAAAAFARARSLSAHGSALYEDALAREVEAHHASGNAGLARERAELYRRLYPKGLRLRQVLRSGGVKDAP
ncbi:MAG TPA: FecR family protein [Polyangiaceae bacterium]|jgi:transmembrane sensor